MVTSDRELDSRLESDGQSRLGMYNFNEELVTWQLVVPASVLGGGVLRSDEPRTLNLCDRPWALNVSLEWLRKCPSANLRSFMISQSSTS
jgi:hypothetical protein